MNEQMNEWHFKKNNTLTLMLSVLSTGQSIVPLAEKTATTTLTSKVLASCWACSAHSHGSKFEELIDGLPAMLGCLLV